MRKALLLFFAFLAAISFASGQKPDSTHSAQPAVDPVTYTIGPADVLEVTVWKEPTLTGSVPVRPDGQISLALLGDLPAAGLTPQKLAANIAEGLKKYIQDPSVYVVVTGVNSKRVFLVGEVQRVGPLPLTSEMTPLQAIASAGGLTPYANAKHIYILRSEAKRQVKIPFNYKKALKGTAPQNVVLLSGDTIVVP
jgi:polysaccharide export outer membrane protein